MEKRMAMINLGEDGGSARAEYVRSLAVSLARQGRRKVDIFTGNHGKEKKVEQVNEDVQIVYLPAPPWTEDTEDLLPVLDSVADGILGYIHEREIDYEFFHSHGWEAGYAAIKIVERSGSWFMHTPHSLALQGGDGGDFPELDSERRHQRKLVELEKNIFKKARGIIALKNTERADYRDSYRYEGENVAVIPPGVDTGIFFPALKGEEKDDVGLPERYVLTMARNNLHHGLDRLIHVFAALAGKHPHLFLIIGTYGKTTDRRDALQKDKLAKIAQDYGLEERIMFPRITDRELLVSYYRRAGAYIDLTLSGRHDPALMEAMACGAPVVVSAASPARVFLSNNRDALIVNPRSNDDIRLAVERILGTEPLRRSLALNAVKTVGEKFSWAAVAKEHLNLAMDGLVWIKDGKIGVLSPYGLGDPASLEPCEGVEVIINGELVERGKNVYAEDGIVLKPVDETVPARIDLSIARDELSAEVEAAPQMRITYTLLDQKPSNHLKLQAERTEKVHRRVLREEILAVLKENGVVYGIDGEALEELSASDIPLNKVVARGDPVQNGVDGYVEYLVSTEKEKVVYDEEVARVNYRERYIIPQVNEGDFLGVIHPPVEGEAGRSVRGHELPPPPVKEASVICRDGVALNEDRTMVIAEAKGRPVIRKGREAAFKIDPYYVHYGNVSMNTGNVSFKGHLRVEGFVDEGMGVSADGDLHITENTTGAYISAGGNVNIGGNCINSDVMAGGLSLLCRELRENLNFLKTSMGAAVENYKQIVEVMTEKRKLYTGDFPRILNRILQVKFPEVFDLAERIEKLLLERTRFPIPDTAARILNELILFFLKEGLLEARDEQSLKRVHRLISEAINILAPLAAKKQDIIGRYAQNSKLECTGDIIIDGPGVYNSTFECGGKVIVQRLFRGGHIKAGGDIFVGELGSPGTSIAQGLVQVPDGNAIKLGKVYEGTRIKIGDSAFMLASTYNRVIIHYDEAENKVKVSYW
ncbi:MAG: DUF342 domain-containing protein [Firmicutes bacterium]|jgi:glycosyltransferase involved in cell wall biosynthesis|nr:DUF342 domain-containing protein [Bacillota bacterium]